MPQDYARAMSWYRRAAESADYLAHYAQAVLGDMYERGQGEPQDYVLAHMWFNLSAARGDAEAARKRDLIAGKMTPAQIAEAQKLAREWKPAPSGR